MIGLRKLIHGGRRMIFDVTKISFTCRSLSSSSHTGVVLQVDRSGLYPINDTIHLSSTTRMENKDEVNARHDFSAFLSTQIHLRGPLSVSEYMRQALTHPTFGYYTTTAKAIFGQHGDFITAPEISQCFGECLSLWAISIWQNNNATLFQNKTTFQIVEIGPGKGTLQVDFIRTAKQFPDFYKAFSHLHLVEVSPGRIKVGLFSIRIEIEVELQSIQATALECESISTDETTTYNETTMRIPNGPLVTWHTELNTVPSNQPSIFLAQELFDALPVHQFEYTSKGWCEILIDMNIKKDEEYSNNINIEKQERKFRFILSPGKTAAVQAFLEHPLRDKKRHNVGDRIEVCPTGIALIQDVAKRIETFGGGKNNNYIYI